MNDTPMKTALFNPLNGQLEQLFSYIDMGDLGLPDIQRPFVWRDSKVRDLFDSLYRGFPIGSYLLWRNNANGRTHQIGIVNHGHSEPNLLIIDGQQRLTALYSVFRAVPVKDENYNDRVIKIAFNPCTEEFRVSDAATVKNPEFINNISDLYTKAGTRKFINEYLENLVSEKENLKSKCSLLLDKIMSEEELNKGDVDLLYLKIKDRGITEDEKIVCEKLGFWIGTESVDDSVESQESDENDEIDIVERVNTGISLLNVNEIDTIRVELTREDILDDDVLSSRIEKLYNLKNYPFNALEIVPDLTEEQVAEIFTRINSKGTVLKQADFILTLLSVFWPEGRSQIDRFCQLSKQVPDKTQKESPYNHIFEPTPKDLVRIIAGYGFGKGKMKDVYSILSGRDTTTKKVSETLRQEQFENFKNTQKITLDTSNWHEFLKIILGLGFKSKDLISSSNNIANAYILYLIARNKYDFDYKELERYIGKWFFFSSIISRYSFSPETQMESDLYYFNKAKSKADLISTIESIIKNELTNDFWEITVPHKLLVTTSNRNAIRNAFFSGLVRKGTNVLFSDRKLGDLFDPALKKKKKDLEKHHIFPKNYLKQRFDLDSRQINQVANFTYLEYEDNIDISDDSPEDYYNNIKNNYYKNKEIELESAMLDHCIPINFYKMSYEDFLKERRKLMAISLRRVFESL